MTPLRLSQRRQRCAKVNALIQVIASVGRRFFRASSGDVSFMEVSDRGRVYFVDSWRGSRVYTHRGARWKGFHDGGTLRALVESFRDFICTGEGIHPGHFGSWRDWVLCGGDLWGYGESMQVIRDAAKALGVTRELGVSS